MSRLLKALHLPEREEGVTIVEYGVTVALVSLVLAAALVALGNEIFGYIGDAVDAAI